MSISMSIFPILNISIISLKIDISISCLFDIIFAKILGLCDIVSQVYFAKCLKIQFDYVHVIPPFSSLHTQFLSSHVLLELKGFQGASHSDPQNFV